MEQIKSIIDLLKKINSKNTAVLDSCSDDKLQQDMEYENLYQALWLADFKLKNAIGLLEAVERELAGCRKN